MLEKRRFIILITLVLLITVPIVSHATLILELPVPPWVKNIAQLSALQKYIPGIPPGICKWILWIDPLNVEEFQIDVAFDPTRAKFSELNYIDPYVQTTSPDLSRLGDGLLQDVAGRSKFSPPPTGEVDIFSVIFEDLRPDLDPVPVFFTVFASDNDFIKAFDTDIGQSITIGPEDIIPASCNIPEPSTLLLLGSGLAGIIGYGRKRLFKKA